jgi:bla regulator protein blaR1
MENLTEIFSNPLAKALGWTLVHALWQMLAVVLVYFAVGLFTKKAKLRYWTGMGLLAFQFGLSLLTFGYLQSLTTSSTANFQGVAMAPKVLSSLQVFLTFLQTNLPIFVGMWAVGCVVLFVRLALGYVWVNKLKNNPKNQVDEKLTQMMHELKAKMNISQQVSVRVSTLVTLPMIMGVLKPVILIPMSIVTGFSEEQLATILAHELAHLKRRDFLFNGLQSVLDVLYFFHPAMWLLSAQIRKERENCCDDMALQVSGNRILLAKTLVQLQEGASAPQLAMAFGKKKYTLLERVQRIVGVHQPKNLTKESLILVLGLFVSFMTFAQIKAEEPKTKAKQTETPIEVKTIDIKGVKSDTTREESFKISIKDEQNDFEIRDDKVFFNGKEVEVKDQEKLKMHLAAINKKHLEINAATGHIQEESQKISQAVSQIYVVQNQESMQKISQQMSEVGQKIGEISSKYASQMNKKGLTEKEREKISLKMDKEIAEYEKKMEALDDEMSVFTDKMEENNPAFEEMERKIQAYEAPIEKLSQELDAEVEGVLSLLPENIRNSVQKSMHDAPKPPKPPKAPKAPKAPKNKVKNKDGVPQVPPVPKMPPAPPVPIKD